MIMLPRTFVETKIFSRAWHIGSIGRFWRVGAGYNRKSSSPIATDVRCKNILRGADDQYTVHVLKRCLRGVTYRDVLSEDEGDASSAEFTDANR